MYRVLLTDEAGRTAAAHFAGPFDSEADLLALACTGLAPGQQVQVWHGDRLLDGMDRS